MTKRLLLLLVLASVFPAMAQVSPLQGNPASRGCSTPTLPATFETWLLGLVPTGKYGTGMVNSVFNIPVVVHVIHNNETVNTTAATTGNNLNAAQILDQINILNKDFNGTNPDTLLIPTAFKPALGKLQFNFCLAVVNPTGGVMAEPGIDRIDRNNKGWTAPPYSQTYINTTIKANSIWDPTKYMNMWVCAISGNILGFATFPNPGTSGLSGLNPPYGSATTDGLVMRNTAFGSIGTAQNAGPYNKGRTATHEIGHWVGLRHIWGDGVCATDYCADTPPAQQENYGCPTHPFNVGICTGNTTGEMTMNYMDYTDDACMYMFSKDQKNRAQLIMTNSPLRSSLLTSTVCNLPTVQNEIGILFVSNPTYSQVINCNNFFTPILYAHNFGVNNITSATYTYNVDGVGTQTYTWGGNLPANTTGSLALPAISNLSNGAHVLNVGVSSPNGGTDPNLLNNTNNQYFSIANSFVVSIAGPTMVCQSTPVSYTASGATTYTWNPGGMTGSVLPISPLTSQLFTVTGKTGTCINTKTIGISVSVPPPVVAPSQQVCAGSVASLSPSGACSYTFTGIQFPFTPTSTTVYTVTGECPGTCTGSATGTISLLPAPPINVAANPTGPLCPGSTTTLTATGGTAYTWGAGQTTSQVTISPTSTTVYSVTGLGTNGCSLTKTISVATSGSPTNANILPASPSLCQGQSLQLTAAGAGTYNWSTSQTSTSITVTPSVNTTYSLLVTNGACTAMATTIVTVQPNPTLNITASPTGTLCAGSTVSLSVTGAQSYSWNTGASGSIVVASPSANTIYSVTGFNGNCSNTQTVGVSVSSQPLILTIIASPDTICTGGIVQLAAAGANSYTWSNGVQFPTITLSAQHTTVYTVTGSNGICVASASVGIVVVPGPPLLISSPVIVCPGGSATLTASGPYTIYNWNAFTPGPTVVVTPTATTTYSIHASGSPGGCTNDGQVTISVANNPVFTTLTATNSVCDQCTGLITPASTGGTPPFSYTVDNVACGPCTGLCPGLHILHTADLAGCITTNYFSIVCSGLATGIDVMNTEGWQVYPNPALTRLTIKVNGEFNYTVYAITGQVLTAGNGQQEKDVDLSEMADGVYVLKLSSNGTTRVQKLIKTQ